MRPCYGRNATTVSYLKELHSLERSTRNAADHDRYRHTPSLPAARRPGPGRRSGGRAAALRLRRGNLATAYERGRTRTEREHPLPHAPPLGPHRGPDWLHLWELVPITPRQLQRRASAPSGLRAGRLQADAGLAQRGIPG